MFEGLEVEAATLNLGTVKVKKAVGHREIGEEVYLVIKAQIADVTHGDTKIDGDIEFTRIHKADVYSVAVLGEIAGRVLFEDAKKIQEAEWGNASFGFDSDEGSGSTESD